MCKMIQGQAGGQGKGQGWALSLFMSPLNHTLLMLWKLVLLRKPAQPHLTWLRILSSKGHRPMNHPLASGHPLLSGITQLLPNWHSTALCKHISTRNLRMKQLVKPQKSSFCLIHEFLIFFSFGPLWQTLPRVLFSNASNTIQGITKDLKTLQGVRVISPKEFCHLPPL